MKNKIRIALGDLRHQTVGRHSSQVPLGISFIASYVLACYGSGEIEIRLYDDPCQLLEDTRIWRPQIIGLSNYCWNSELSRFVFKYAKSIDNKILTVAGGPNFPIKNKECRDYLADRDEIDLYVYREGEVVFSNIVREFMGGNNVWDLKSSPINGVMSIQSSKFIQGPPVL